MENVVLIQMEQEAKDIIQFNESVTRAGKNKPKQEGNCYTLTLKYLFAVKDLKYKDVAQILNITTQGVNHLVNRTQEKNFKNVVFARRLCQKLNIDYRYFCELAEKVKELM